MHLGGEVAVCPAEPLQAKLKCMARSAAHAHDEEISDLVVDGAYEFFLGKGGGDAAFELVGIVLFVEQHCVGLVAVASRPSRFLEILLDGVGGRPGGSPC